MTSTAHPLDTDMSDGQASKHLNQSTAAWLRSYGVAVTKKMILFLDSIINS